MPRSLQQHRKRNKRSKIMVLTWEKARRAKLQTVVGENSNTSECDVSNILPFVDIEYPTEMDNRANESSESSVWEADSYRTKIPGWCSETYAPKLPKQFGVISSDEYERIMSHEIECESVSKSTCPIEGNRIVELSYVLDWAINLQYSHSKLCTMGIICVKKETRKGLVSSIQFGCNTCSNTFSFSTENPHRQNSVINVGAVWGTLSSGSTYSHMSEFLSSMDVPTMSKRSFYELENEMGKEWETSLSRSMKLAGEKERQLAIENKQTCPDGTPWITVYVDGSWSKRSYGTNYNALSGMIGIIGKRTGEVLFLGVRNKYCTICHKADTTAKQPKDHLCYKNWDGSAPAMESDMVIDGFNQSEAMHGVRYCKFIADGDSSVFINIQTSVSYGAEVKKVECTNHALKNYGKRLRSIKADKQINLKGRKLLTINKIKLLSKRAKCSIYEHSKKEAPNIDLLRYDLRGGLHHIFGDHSKCREDICKSIGDDTGNMIAELKSTTIFNHINGALDLLVQKAHLLIENENNNRAEILMNIVARFNQGKRLNLIQRGSYQRRTNLSGLRYNKGVQWHSSPYKKVMGCSPGTHFKTFIKRSYNQHERKCRKRLFPNLKKETGPLQKKKMKLNKDYGSMAEEPIIEQAILEKEINVIVERLQVSEMERNRIQEESVGQFGNQLYESERKFRLTASVFGQVIKRRSYTPCHNMVKACLLLRKFWSEATEYGIAKEKVAIGLFESLRNLKVQNSGFWVDLEYGFLGASPDGIVLDEDAIVEVKCLYSASKLEFHPKTIEEIVEHMKSKICLEKYENGMRLKRNHNYFYQVQGQLHITGKSKCYFVVYINDGIDLFVEEIEKDPKFWKEKMCPKLIQFFKECIAPEIVSNNLGKGRKCIDPPFILEAIKAQETKKKKIIDARKKKQVRTNQHMGDLPRTVSVPDGLTSSFLQIASNNTVNNIETCGILAGKFQNNVLQVTHLIIPKQSGTSYSCTASHEEKICETQNKYDLMTIGWIHTHPTQTAFMSSVDLHTQCVYQLLMPEAIAIVCSPKYNDIKYFNLTSRHGVQCISDCRKTGFHPHPEQPPLFQVADHVTIDKEASLDIIDLREVTQ